MFAYLRIIIQQSTYKYNNMQVNTSNETVSVRLDKFPSDLHAKVSIRQAKMKIEQKTAKIKWEDALFDIIKKSEV